MHFIDDNIDFAAYERASAEVFEVFRAYAPRVTPVSLDEALERATHPEDFRISVQQAGLATLR